MAVFVPLLNEKLRQVDGHCRVQSACRVECIDSGTEGTEEYLRGGRDLCAEVGEVPVLERPESDETGDERLASPPDRPYHPSHREDEAAYGQGDGGGTMNLADGGERNSAEQQSADGRGGRDRPARGGPHIGDRGSRRGDRGLLPGGLEPGILRGRREKRGHDSPGSSDPGARKSIPPPGPSSGSSPYSS